jgi:uncharacterized protein YkwD
MASPFPSKHFIFLIMVVFASACAPTPEPAQSPTEVVSATTTPVPLEPQVIILDSQVVVEQILLSDPDQDTGEIEVVAKGSTSNTCTLVEGIDILREGDIFFIEVKANTKTGSECQQKASPFEEIAVLDVQDLEPGDYLVSSGVVQIFEVASAQPSEEPESPADSTEGGQLPEDTTVETGSTESDSQEGGETTTTQPTSDEPLDCQDNAVFVADITYPDNTSVSAGEIFTKTWEIRNEGSCTWGEGYELEFVQGSFDQVVSLEEPFPVVEPQESVELSVSVTTPGTAGTHSGIWVIKRPEGDTIQTEQGQAFDFWAIVVVPATRTVVPSTETRDLNEDGIVCAQANTGYVNQLLQLINEARAANGLPAYELQPQLSTAAKVLTTDMACNEFINHTGSDGSDWFDRITAQGYDYEDAAENIVFGYGTVPQLAMNWWMDSQIHRGNILSDSLTQIGIAYALNPQTGGSYYTLVFASPVE